MKTNQSLSPDSARGKWSLLSHRLFLSIGMLGIFIVGASILSSCASSQPVTAPPSMVAPTPTDPAPMAAAPALGPEAAPVTIVEYADFGCPTCLSWYKLGVLDKLRAKYGDQIRFVWRDFPVITSLSPKAAEAGQCAHEQGKFWEFHDAVYQHDGAIEANDLQAYAVEIGLNMTQFNDCVTSRRYRDRVNAEEQEAFGRGLNGTPAFFVNDRLVVGPQPLSVFSNIIDPLLASKK